MREKIAKSQIIKKLYRCHSLCITHSTSEIQKKKKRKTLTQEKPIVHDLLFRSDSPSTSALLPHLDRLHNHATILDRTPGGQPSRVGLPKVSHRGLAAVSPGLVANRVAVRQDRLACKIEWERKSGLNKRWRKEWK